MREDFPTFDRPMKAISGRSLFRNCSGPAQLLINSAERILMRSPTIHRLHMVLIQALMVSVIRSLS
jgi:hypothetical protein